MTKVVEHERINSLTLPTNMDATEAFNILDKTGVIYDVGRSDEVVQPHFNYDGGDLTYQQFIGIGGLYRFVAYKERGLLV